MNAPLPLVFSVCGICVMFPIFSVALFYDSRNIRVCAENNTNTHKRNKNIPRQGVLPLTARFQFIDAFILVSFRSLLVIH